jgi:hypothetical protein
MGRPYHRPAAHHTVLLILLPLLATFAAQRLYLHLVGVRHVYPAGYLFHHLFTGVLIVIPAAFILAFGARNRAVAVLTPAALGVGTAMVLDEVIFLVATQATDEDYVSGVSLGGAVVFVGLAVGLLLTLYRLHREEA